MSYVEFTDGGEAFITIESSWQTQKETKEMEVQTMPQVRPEVAIQTLEWESKEVIAWETLWIDFEVQTVEEVNHFKLVKDESNELLTFLKNVCPYMEQQLLSNRRTKIFDSLEFVLLMHRISSLVGRWDYFRVLH